MQFRQWLTTCRGIDAKTAAALSEAGITPALAVTANSYGHPLYARVLRHEITIEQALDELRAGGLL